MPAARHRLAATTITRGRQRGPRSRQGLGKGAGVHPQRPEHGLLHEIREGSAGNIGQQLLDDDIAAAGVAPLAPRGEIHPDRFGIRRRLAVEHLDEGRHRGIHRITREAMHGRTRGVAQQAAQRDRIVAGKFILRQMPGSQRAVHVGIERQLLLLDQAQRAQGRHRLADRAGLEKRVRRDGRPTLETRHPVTLRFHDHAILDDRQRQARDLPLRHQRHDRVIEFAGADGKAGQGQPNGQQLQDHAGELSFGLSDGMHHKSPICRRASSSVPPAPPARDQADPVPPHPAAARPRPPPSTPPERAPRTAPPASSAASI